MCTPVCGPGPRRNLVSGVPSACWIVNETVAGLPGSTLPPGAKSTTFVMRAAVIVGTAGVEAPPQPATAASTATAASVTSAERIRLGLEAESRLLALDRDDYLVDVADRQLDVVAVVEVGDAFADPLHRHRVHLLGHRHVAHRARIGQL